MSGQRWRLDLSFVHRTVPKAPRLLYAAWGLCCRRPLPDGRWEGVAIRLWRLHSRRHWVRCLADVWRRCERSIWMLGRGEGVRGPWRKPEALGLLAEESWRLELL
jgi:hypothetical protein